MSKILIDEAVVRRFVYATAMVVDCAQLEDWQLELYDKAGADLAEALADAALDKMAENARELGLSYEQPAPAKLCKYGNEPAPCTSSPMDCQCAIDAALEQPAQQEPYAWEFIGSIWHDKEEVFAYAKDPELSEESPPLALYTKPPAQEPDPDELTIAYMSGLYEGKKRKPWVGLTDEEIKQLNISAPTMKIAREDVAIIEAKLKEKNS